MTITITIHLPPTAQSYQVAADLVRRFGEEAVEVITEVPDDETADDIALLHQARQIVESDAPDSVVIARLRALQATQGDSNDAMRYLDQLIAAIPPGRDAAPPRGIPKPEAQEPALVLPRPNATHHVGRDTPGRKQALERVRDSVACPTCEAPVGSFCRGPSWGPTAQTYGYQHMHGARIDLVEWPS